LIHRKGAKKGHSLSLRERVRERGFDSDRFFYPLSPALPLRGRESPE
jgi:hypothetical protein